MRKFAISVSLLAFTSVSLCAAPQPGTAPAPGAKTSHAAARYFEANRGQWPAGQDFRAYGYGYGVTLGKEGITLRVTNPAEAKTPDKLDAAHHLQAPVTPPASREVSLRFEGAHREAALSGLDELAAKGAWFQGAQANWQSDIPLFARVRGRQVYPGVDATFYGRDGQLEYDLDVAPGARTSALVFDLDGADTATIGSNGDLSITANGQRIVLHKPLAWQPDGQSRKTVEVSYEMLPVRGRSGQRIGLDLKGYDAGKPLTIDPVLTFGTYLISSTSTLPGYYINGVTIDSSNNVYVLSVDGSITSFTIQKVSHAGTLLYTATFSSSTGNQLEPTAVAVNAGGQAYISAEVTKGFPTTANAFNPNYPNTSYGSSYNAGLAVLSADGSQLVYSTYFGGTANGAYGSDYGVGVAVDAAGNAYLTGQAGGGGFPTTAGAYQTSYTGGYPAGFVAKFNPSASGTASLLYSTLLGGTSTEGYSAAVDSSNNVYLTLLSSSCTGPVTAGAFTYAGLMTTSNCGYVTSVNPTGTALNYSAYIGPGQPLAIAVDGSQDAYVVGDDVTADDFPTTPGAYQASYPDGFAMELNPTGGLVYSTFLSGPSGATQHNATNAASIALIPGCVTACSAYISGVTGATDFPVINGLSVAPPAISTNQVQPFFVVLNGTGSAALSSGYLGGFYSYVNSYSSFPYPYVAVDTAGNAWLAGAFASSPTPDFPVTTGTAPGPTGAWLAEVSMTNAGALFTSPSSMNFGTSIPVNVSSTVYNSANSLTPTTIVIRNVGSVPVTFNSVVASPSYFSETDNCNGGIAASSYCTMTLVFTPQTDAPVTGTLTIASNAQNSPLVVPLSGQGADASFVVASPTTLNFGNVLINAVSTPQAVTLTNAGNEPVSSLNQVYFNYYLTTADGFSGLTNCPASLPPGDSCQTQVTFAPTIADVGPQSVTMKNDYYYYYENYYSVAVNGTGYLPSSYGTQTMALSATSLNFGTVTDGATTATQYVYATNTGSEPITLLPATVTLTSSVGAATDFQVSQPCGLTVAPQSYGCIYVTFTPSAAGTETATLTVPIAGSSSVLTIALVGQGAADTQVLEIEPGNYVFPDQPVGVASSTTAIYAFNTGTASFTVDRVLATGDFSLSQTNCAGDVLPGAQSPGNGNSSCYAYVEFTPAQAGVRTGTLTFIDAASGSPQSVPLSGNGVTAAGVITATPTTLPFGTQVKGTSSAEQYVYLTNSGNIPVNFTAAATTGDYAITSGNCGVLPYSMTPGASCYVYVTFTPMVSSGPDNGTLVLTTSAGSQTVTLTGSGEAGTLASGLSPTAINFGSIQVGQTTTYATVYVRNSGTESLTFSTAATVTGDYSLSDQTCSTASMGTLAPGQFCYLIAYFTPSASGTRAGTLTVKSNAGTLTGSLTGTGVAISTSPSYFNPPEVSFDQQAVGSMSAFQTVTFYYGGNGASFALTGATITAGSANFQLATGANALNTCTTAVGTATYCQVNVVYAPSVAGYQTGTLTVTSNAGSFAVTLSGYAPAVSDAGLLTPSALSFSSQVVSTASGPSSDYQQISLYNTGAAEMTLGTVGGTNFGSGSDFGVFNTYDYCSGQVLAPVDSTTANGGSCYIYVQFTPTAAGTRTGTVTFPVTYSDGTTGTFTANLTGLGVAQKNEAVVGPSLVTFPDTPVGTTNSSYEQYIYLTNSGNLPFTVGTLTGTDTVIGASTTGDFLGTGNGAFDQCSGVTVQPASACIVNVAFLPGSAGAKTGTITFPVTYANASSPTNLTATLTGTGIAASPSLAISPAGIQFDSVTVNAGISGNYQTVTVTNTGNVPVTISHSAISTGFALYADYCTGVTIAPGATCTDYVYFAPTTAKAYTGTLAFTTSPSISVQSVALSGTGLATTASLQFSQNTVSFGSQLVSTATSAYSIYLVNRGTDTVTINTLALSGTNSADYSETDNCAGTSIAPNSTCGVNITFTPSATGTRTATLTETDNGGGAPLTVALSGAGINASTAVVFYPNALVFSTKEPVGEGTPQQLFSVTNSGVNPVTITAVASTNQNVFPVVQDGCTGSSLSTGQSCLVVVLFTPTSAAAASGYIEITDNAFGSPQKLPVSGTGITGLTSSVTLTPTPASGPFGTLFTLTAAVADQNSSPLSNGRVTFYDGTTVLGTAQVVTTTSGGGVIGTATLKTILVPLGSNSITAKYVGADVTSTSAASVVTVTGTYPTTTAFASSGSAGNYTFDATVSGGGPITPTGSVTFTDGTTSLVPGTASLQSSTLAQTFVTTAPTSPSIPALAVGLGDVNGDGIPDLVTGTTAGLYVQLGNGDGTFQTLQLISSSGVSAGGDFPVVPGSSIAFGDFNGDGKVDIAFVACTNGISPCSVGVLLGNGNGTFQHERFYDPSNGIIGGIALGDFDGDGVLDIVVANYSGSTVDLLLGNGDGTFQEPLPTPMPGASSVAAGDLNGDGKLDVVVTNWGYSTVSVLLGKGNGIFQPAASYSTPASGYPTNATLADLRSVGKQDIVLMDYNIGVSVLLGNGDGTFQGANSVFNPGSPANLINLAVADVNGDGKPDVIVTDSGNTAVDVLAGSGSGTFPNSVPYSTGAEPNGVAVADLNHDGRLDMAVANYNMGNSVSLFVNQVTQVAQLSNTTVPGTGTHSLTAAYAGNANFAASTSNALQLTASLVTPAMTLTPQPGATVAWAQQLSIQVVLTRPLSWVPAPSGTVGVSIDGGAATQTGVVAGAVTIPINQLSVGAHSIAISYAGDQFYTPLSAQTQAITVIKANQTITFNALPAVTYGVAPITLTASASSGLPISYGVSGPGTLGGTNNNILTITGFGTVVVTASQAGNIDYNAATSVVQNQAVNKATLNIVVNSASKVYGAALPIYSGTVTGIVNNDAVTITYSCAATASSPVGLYPITATISGAAAPNYTLNMTPGTLSVTKAPLTVTANPATRIYGVANPAFTDVITGFVNGDPATVVTGTASLTTTATTTSTVGAYPITAALGSLTAANYAFTTFVNNTLSITKAPSTISWAMPAPITYGTALSGVQLNATSAVNGSFTYTPPSGTILGAGTQTLSVTLTPADTTDYAMGSATVSLTVNKATPNVTCPVPAAITYGTGLSNTQLACTTSPTVSGSFAYAPVSGTVLTAGVHTITATFTPGDTTDYNTGSGSFSLTVNQAKPSITWATPAAITYGTALSATQLNATSPVAGGFAYTPALGAVLTAGAQTLSATLTPSDTTDYSTATATVSLTVKQAKPTITWHTPAAISYGTALSSTQLNATATFGGSAVAGTLAYNPAAGTVPAVGTNVLSVTFTPTDSTDYLGGSATVNQVVYQTAAMISPAAGSVLAGPSIAFSWTAAPNATGYYLWIGTTGAGSNNVYNSALKTGTSYTFSSMPTNGAPIYVRLITDLSGVWLSTDYVYTAATQAVMTSPAAGSTFAGPGVAFSWTTAASATGYYLWIGSTGVGSNNIYNSALKTVTSYTFPSMPTNGEVIYVRLTTNFNGAWVHADYTYTAAQQALLTSPTQGATFTGTSVTFTWSAAPNATNYYLLIGSTGVGSNNIYNSAPKTVTSYTFNGMPTNGETIYVRLTTNFNGTWLSKDYTFKAEAIPAIITAPAAGSTLPGPSATFTWSAPSGATGYYLQIGTSGVGSDNVYNSAEKTVNTYTFSSLPTNGGLIYVRLTTNYNGTWVSNDYTYTAAAQAVMTSPVQGSTFSGASVTFSWTTAANATGYYLQIGSTAAGSDDIYNSGEKTGTSYTYPAMPTNGETIYVRLITNYNGTWVHNDYTYTAQ